MTQTISGHAAIKSVKSRFLRLAYVPGRPIHILVRRAYAPLFLRLMVLLDQVEQLKNRNTWSYNYRAPRMGSGISDHAGYAVDCWSDGIGAHTWPSRMPEKQAREIAAILNRFRTKDGRYVFLWGASSQAPGVSFYKGPKYSQQASNDPMHFAIAPGITIRDALQVRRAMKIKFDGTIRK